MKNDVMIIDTLQSEIAALHAENARLQQVVQDVSNQRADLEHVLATTLLQRAQLEQEIAEQKLIGSELTARQVLLTQLIEQQKVSLKTAQEQLSRAVRLQDELLANMSHELRTPLNTILGLSELLQEEGYGALNEQQHYSLHTIRESGYRLLNLVNTILDIAKIEAGKLALNIDAILVYSVCQSSLESIREAACEKHLGVFGTFDPRVKWVRADRQRLKQVLMQLLSNAVKFTPKGGQIGLDVHMDTEQLVVHLSVWDSGIGITTEDQECLFQPFLQGDSSLGRQYEGIGLGLALVKRLVEIHQGNITVQSKPGKGSRFTVSLPGHSNTPVLGEGIEVLQESSNFVHTL